MNTENRHTNSKTTVQMHRTGSTHTRTHAQTRAHTHTHTHTHKHTHTHTHAHTHTHTQKERDGGGGGGWGEDIQAWNCSSGIRTLKTQVNANTGTE